MARRRRPVPDDAAPGGDAAAAGYAPALKAGVQSATLRVHEMHHAIAAKTFDALDRVPGLAVPARMVRAVHDAVTAGAYAAVRQGAGAVLEGAAAAERLWVTPSAEPSRRKRHVRNALNAVAGDALQQAGNPLAIEMGVRRNGEPLALTRQSLAQLAPSVCLFVHGLACDEHSWHLHADRWHDTPWAGVAANYGVLLERELGYEPLYLRYNTGLPIAENAHRLATMLAQLVAEAPQVEHIVIVGHSMGGLLARLACEAAGARHKAWQSKLRMLVCLGSPHRGAPLEQLGHLVQSALGVSDVTRPLAAMANGRSQGIKDLRVGLRGQRRPAATPALRLVAGSLADERHAAWAPLLDAVIGDGLVTTSSASDAALSGDVERVMLPGLGHMALLNHPQVYERLKAWLSPWARPGVKHG